MEYRSLWVLQGLYQEEPSASHITRRGFRLSQLPLIDGVARYVRENNISLCMPGHKGGNGFLDTPKGVELYKDIIKYDITEVEGVDNLHHPEGIIKEAEDLLADYYESRKSYFLVNGSTSGNMAMIFSSF